jgi:hypothetical protein
VGFKGMIFYISQFILVSFFAYIHSYHKNERFSVTAKWICLLLLFIPSALRYNIGTDYVNYKSIFNVIQKTGQNRTEIAWVYLNKLIIALKLPFQYVIAIASALTIFPFIKTKKKDFFIIIILFSCLYYLNSFNITRQVIAMAFIWAAYLFILERKFIISFLWILCAGLFHDYAFLFLPVFIIAEFVPLTKKRVLIGFISFVILSFIINTYLVPIIMGLKYKGENYIFYTENLMSFISILKALPRFSILFFMIYFLDEKKIEAKEKNYVYWLTLFLSISDFYGISFLIIQRIRIYFFIAYLAAFKNLVLNTEKKEKIANLIFLAFIIANFLLRYLWVGSGEVIPYATFFGK